MRSHRIEILLAAVPLVLAGGLPAQAERAPKLPSSRQSREVVLDRESLLQRARKLAQSAYAESPQVEGWLAELDYDAYRSIRFREDQRIWQGAKLGYEMDLLHVGGIFKTAVAVHLVSGGAIRPIEFAPEMFDYGGLVEKHGSPPGQGFSGLRLRAPLNRPEVMDEFLVFQGATYFRAVARGQLYGVSARGLALRTGDPRGEEFPEFREFWIERPSPKAQQLRVHALLDSPSVTGVCSFTASPGDETVIDVELTLFARKELKKLGIAPLTSMFLFSKGDRAGFDDYRAAVHDSDGLQMVTGSGDRLWRPLSNPRALEMSAFVDRDPKGFGLMQRKRGFRDYGDLEARYEKRPSAWVEPLDDWGPGAVVLVEIPAKEEFHDNIVAFWQPQKVLAAGESVTWRYRLRFLGASPDVAPVARVVSTRTGSASNNSNRLFVIDYSEVAAKAPVVLRAEASTGKLVDQRLEALPGSSERRVILEFRPIENESSELRVWLESEGKSISEVWLHRWTQ